MNILFIEALRELGFEPKEEKTIKYISGTSNEKNNI
jgi:hypothetical protein